jgi:phospholipid transport system substrate-binding protein
LTVVTAGSIASLDRPGGNKTQHATSLTGRNDEIGINPGLAEFGKKREDRASQRNAGGMVMTTLVIGRRGVLMAGVAVLLATSWSAPAAADDPVLVPAHELIAGLLKVMKAGNTTPFSSRFDILAPVIDETFDLAAILRESVGPATWQSTPADQQQTLLAAFRRYTIASYVSSFDAFNGQRFTIDPETRSVGDEQVVKTQIVPVSGNGHELGYVMRETPAGWRIVDVLADGAISRVAVQRSDFRRLIRVGGADALSQSLKVKSEGLWN